MPLFCNYDSLITESDVEQKFIYPFLTSSSPLGLSLEDSQILTKSLLRRKAVGKGQSQKYYYPDYLIFMRGIPILVVEAKKPNEDLATAYSEARLYAEEVNAGFPHNINVCQMIIVCNGTETWAGYADHAEPVLRLSFGDFNVENIKYIKLLEFCSKQKMEEISNKPYVEARGKSQFFTPVSLLGGKRVQNEELEENSFGRTFVFENRNIFDPQTEEDRIKIVENAYIHSVKREQHIEPMYKEIRKFELPNQNNTTPLSTENPIELVQKISQRIDDKNEAYSLILVVGNVGSGKTTFVRYFKTMFLEKQHLDLANKCDWVFINMNFAPLTNDEIYDWLKNDIINQIKNNHQDIDFNLLDVIKKIFKKQVYSFANGIGQLLKDDDRSYQKELYELLKENLSNSSIYLESLLIFLKERYGLLPIIVLDNCDNRNKDEQLLMFQVAQWLRTTFKCIVILPMRDSTYDSYRDEPPLDTVVKDLVFRIDPPDLFKVIQARLDYIIRITNLVESTYNLNNGMNVSINKLELIEYFKCIMVAIRNNRMIADIFYRLSDRNTRSGIELFENFCKSGHISEEDILKIRTVGSDYEIAGYKFMNAILRKNRKYYNGEESNVVNLFYANYNDDFPDPFVRIDILRWLKDRIAKEGPSKTKGMFPVHEIIRDMQVIGHDAVVVYRELNYLVKRGLIMSESLTNQVEYDELVKVSLPGIMHLKMLSNIVYLAACAEDVIYKNTTVMTSISRRLSSNAYLSKLAITLTAHEMIEYLSEYRKEFCSYPESYIIDDAQNAIYNLAECKDAIGKWLDNDKHLKNEFDKLQIFYSGVNIRGTVINKGSGSLVCLFGINGDIKGFISALDRRYQLEYVVYDAIHEGDMLECEILEFDYEHNSFRLKYISKVEIC